MTIRNRNKILLRIRRRLEHVGYPRLQMLLIVVITGGFGFLASFLLLSAGMDAMWLRYPCAVLSAYLAFLLLLWLWLRTNAVDYADVPDPGALPNLPDVHSMSSISGGGGHGGGAGASASFDGPDVSGSASSIDLPAVDLPSSDLPSVGDAVSAVGDADEFAIPLAFIVLVAVLLLSSLWIVYIAPALFAELLLDGALATTLYRRLRRSESQHWLQTAVTRTVWLFLGVALLAGAVGAVLGWSAPGARSLGEAIQLHEMKP